jgi:hypothetical protein
MPVGEQLPAQVFTHGEPGFEAHEDLRLQLVLGSRELFISDRFQLQAHHLMELAKQQSKNKKNNELEGQHCERKGHGRRSPEASWFCVNLFRSIL